MKQSESLITGYGESEPLDLEDLNAAASALDGVLGEQPDGSRIIRAVILLGRGLGDPSSYDVGAAELDCSGESGYIVERYFPYDCDQREGWIMYREGGEWCLSLSLYDRKGGWCEIDSMPVGYKEIFFGIISDIVNSDRRYHDENLKSHQKTSLKSEVFQLKSAHLNEPGHK